MGRRTVFISAAVVTVLLSIAFFIVLLKAEITHPKLPVYSSVGAFELTDQSGHAFGLKELYGKPWVASFFFTTCSGICPRMTSNMASINQQEGEQIDLVSISVNPENDTPQVLSGYAQKFKANQNWHFLTGPIDQIQKLSVERFKIGSVNEPVFHSDRFVLVDRKGQIRGYYEGTDPESLKKLNQDINYLKGEKRH